MLSRAYPLYSPHVARDHEDGCSLLTACSWRYYIVFDAVLCVAILTVWFFYPETKGHTLEEMAVVFDGPDAAVYGTGKGVVGDQLDKGDLGVDVVHDEGLDDHATTPPDVAKDSSTRG